MKRILVVDDEEIIRANLSRILKEEKYHVHTVADGRSALSIWSPMTTTWCCWT